MSSSAIGRVVQERSKYWKEKQERFANRYVILPSLGLGNVGQLALDLILTTLKARRHLSHIGTFQSPFLRPFAGVGPLALPHDREVEIATAAEVYSSPEAILIQLRSAPYEGYEEHFLEDLFSWFQEMKCKGVIMVGGQDASLREDKDIQGPSLPYIFPTKEPALDVVTFMEGKLGWTKGKPVAPPPHSAGIGMTVSGGAPGAAESKEEGSDGSSEEGPLANIPKDVKVDAERLFAPVSGCGLARRAWRRASAAAVPFTAALMYVFEGDNIPDAFFFADRIKDLSPALQEAGSAESSSKQHNGAAEAGVPPGGPQWIPPMSWKEMFGPEPDAMLYTQ